MTGASQNVRERIRAFRAGITRRNGVSVTAIFHPDLDETWVHLRSINGRLTTVSFCDDDPDGVYVIVRVPDTPPRLARGSDTDILDRLNTDLASWPTT